MFKTIKSKIEARKEAKRNLEREMKQAQIEQYKKVLIDLKNEGNINPSLEEVMERLER